MGLDKLYSKIEHSLKVDRIDSELFEQCAQFLLVDVYPSLVPVRGGGDGGFDGAVGDIDGGFPLVCTTRTDVIGNVRKNIEKYLEEKPHGTKKAVVATTQFLTPTRRKNIEKTAEKLGVVVINIHDGSDFVNRLYRDPAWRRKLLGLSGKNQALSVLPLHGRFDAQGLCIGREVELEKIAKQSGDLLLIGQPGSGKTFLYQKLAIEQLCLFVASDNIEDIADEVRSKQPPIIVLDDAHTKTSLLQQLVRMRAEIDAEFAIHANCWPGHESQCRSILGTVSSSVLELRPLTRDKICEVIKSVGIAGPNSVLDLLIEQAAGKPGLAVVLALACLRGQTEQVWTGELLADHLLAKRQVASKQEERSVLATFGLSGDYGLPMRIVGDSLGLPVTEVQSIVTNLSAGGVIEECGNDRIAIYPSELRSLLVAMTFFSGAASIPLGELLAQIPDRSATAHVLMSARQRGGKVPVDTILALIGDSNNRKLWEHFGHVDAECARLILNHYPRYTHLAAPGVLHYYPDEAIEQLLQIQLNEKSSPDGSIENPRRRISEWITGDVSEHVGHIDRRHRILGVTKKMLPLSEDYVSVNIGWAMARLIQVTFKRTGHEPGNDRVFNWTSGVYLGEGLRDVAKLWPEIMKLLNYLPLRALSPVLDQIENWCFPGRHQHSGPLPDSDCDFMIATGKKMLMNILDLPLGHRAIRSWAAHTAQWADIEVQIETDPDYEAMFQEHTHGDDYEEEAEKRARSMASLAERLSKQNASVAIEYINQIEQEASELHRTKGGWDRQRFYRELAGRVADPKLWLRELVVREFDAFHVNPFIESTIKKHRDEAPVLLDELMGNELYQQFAVYMAIELKPFGKELALKAVDLLAGGMFVNTYGLMRLDAPIEIRRVLLTHSNKTLRGRAAVAEWLRDPEGLPEAGLLDDWKSAILDAGISEEHHLVQILKSDSDLAHAWMVHYFKNAEDYRIYEHANLLIQISSMLDRDHRLEILRLVSPRSYDMRVFDTLIAGDSELVDQWFEMNNDDEYLRMKPLCRGPSDQWVRLAERALENGVTPSKLAQECWPHSSSWSGPASKHFEILRDQYKMLLDHPDPRIHETGRLGMDWTERRMADEQRAEHEEAVYGLHSARRRRRINRS